MTSAPRVLFVEDDPSLRRVAEYHLKRAGFDVTVQADGHAGWQEFARHGADCVVTDLALPELDGDALLQRIKSTAPETEVIIITAYGTVDRAVHAMKAGAFDFITKPFEFDVLVMTIERAVERQQLRRENVHLKAELAERFRPENMVGASPAMDRIFDLVRRLGTTDTNVLILGESGTGKELVARAIHHSGPRREAPFVAVNCGALPRDLIESELFGVAKGAYTGADHDRPGRFERAADGTLFLDEITELPPDLQVKLLRALQEREIERLGGTETVPVRARFICATNADPAARVAQRTFRQDLYFRINVVTITVPPLRERPEDIRPLVDLLLKRLGAAGLAVEPAFMEALHQYAWPGNVRELENAIERAIVLRGRAERLCRDDLPEEVRFPGRFSAARPGTGEPALPDQGINFSDWEKSLLQAALQKAGGNRSRAARLLGMTRQTLLYRLRKFGLQPERSGS